MERTNDLCELIKITHARGSCKEYNCSLSVSFKRRFLLGAITFIGGGLEQRWEIKREYPLNISFGIHLSSEIALLSQTAI